MATLVTPAVAPGPFATTFNRVTNPTAGEYEVDINLYDIRCENLAIVVANASGVPTDLTVIGSLDDSWGLGKDQTFTIAAGTTKVVGPFESVAVLQQRGFYFELSASIDAGSWLAAVAIQQGARLLPA